MIKWNQSNYLPVFVSIQLISLASRGFIKELQRYHRRNVSIQLISLASRGKK